MRKILIIFFSIIYFLAVNTSYFWEKLPGLWDMLITLILFLGFFIFVIILIIQIVYLIQSKYSNRNRIINCIILLIILITTAFFPKGIIDFRKFEGPNLVLAVYKGVANCTTTLEIKKDKRFIERSICFGVEENSGRYELKGDTITMYFDKKANSVSSTAYGIIILDSIRTEDNIGQIIYYKGSWNTNRVPMKILEYNIN
jgi:hypothetical protein